jgi:aminopeptidase N
MWFGNMVTMKWWDDLWLNESFATFIAYVCIDKCEELSKSYSSPWVIFNNQKIQALSADQLPSTRPIKSEIINTIEADESFDEIVYKKGSSIIKQLYYYLGEENFSKGLSNYFNEYQWKNVEFEDFINKMIQVDGEKYKDLNNLCQSWIQKAGVNEISLDMTADPTTNKISKFVVNQKPCLEQFPNMITHFVDFLFVYDFEDDSKNKIFKRQIIEPKNETVFDFSNELVPKLIFLNYNDYGYMKLNISYMNKKDLKQYLSKCKDSLITSALDMALYDSFKEHKISSIEYLDIIFAIMPNEMNEETLFNLLVNITKIFFNNLPLKYILEYKKKFFNALKNVLERQLSLIEPSKDTIKNILSAISDYAVEDDQKKYLIKLLNLDSKYLIQSKRFSYIKSIYASRTIPLEEKEALLNKEIKRDKNSNDSAKIKIECDSALPDRKNKEKIWKMIIEESDKDITENMQALMAGFAPVELYDLVEDFLTQQFFEVLPKIKNASEDFIYLFTTFMGPANFTNNEVTEKLKNIINEFTEDKENPNMNVILDCLMELSEKIEDKKDEEERCAKYLESNK